MVNLLQLVASATLILVGCFFLHFVAMHLLFGTLEISELAGLIVLLVFLLSVGGFLAHRAFSRPSLWQNKLGLVYGKRLASLVGVLVLAFFAFNALVFYATSETYDNIRASLTENPIIQKHIGEITRFREDRDATHELRWSLRHRDQHPRRGDIFVFKVEGKNGKGVVTADLKTVQDSKRKLMSGTLVLEAGETHDLSRGSQ